MTDGSIEPISEETIVESGDDRPLPRVDVTEPVTVRLIRTTDTTHLERLCASEALVENAREREDLRVGHEPEPLEFENGSLPPSRGR